MADTISTLVIESIDQEAQALFAARDYKSCIDLLEKPVHRGEASVDMTGEGASKGLE